MDNLPRPKRSSSTEERLNLPQIDIPIPKVPMRSAKKKTSTKLPPIGRVSECRDNSMSLRSVPVPYNSFSTSNVSISRTRPKAFNSNSNSNTKRCTTAGGPTSRCSSSVYERLSQLKLGPQDKYRLNMLNNFKTGGNSRPSTSANIDLMNASYYELKQANFTKSPYLPTLSVIDKKQLQALKKSISTISSECAIATANLRRCASKTSNTSNVSNASTSTGITVISAPRPSLQDLSSNTKSSTPISHSLKMSQPQKIPSDNLLGNLDPSILSERSLQPTDQNSNSKKKAEGVLSAYTIMDPGSQVDDEFVFIRKPDQFLLLPDDNNNFALLKDNGHVDSRILTETKMKKRRQDNINNNRAMSTSIRERDTDSFAPSLSPTISHNFVRTFAGLQRNITRVQDPMVKKLSSDMYGKLKNLGLDERMIGKNPTTNRKETLNKLKKAFAVLQQQLNDLNVDESTMSSKGLDFSEFEQRQKWELEYMRKSVNPYKDSFQKVTAADFRGNLPIPVKYLHDIFKAPIIDKTWLPQKMSKKGEVNIKLNMNKKKTLHDPVPVNVSVKSSYKRMSSASQGSSDSKSKSRPKSTVGSQSAMEGKKHLMVQGLISSEIYRKHLQNRGVNFSKDGTTTTTTKIDYSNK